MKGIAELNQEEIECVSGGLSYSYVDIGTVCGKILAAGITAFHLAKNEYTSVLARPEGALGYRICVPRSGISATVTLGVIAYMILPALGAIVANLYDKATRSN